MRWPPSPRPPYTPIERLEIALANVHRKTGITAAQILGPSHERSVSHARKLVWCDMVANGASQSEAGRLTGRDPSTVCYGLRSLRRVATK